MKSVFGNIITLAESGQYTHVLHGCNCMCLQGAGVARTIADAWPEVYAADKETTVADRSKLGNFSRAEVKRGNISFNVYNLYTQYRYGPAHEKHFDIDALQAALNAFKSTTSPQGVKILIPMIGTGYGGGRWRHVRNVFDSLLCDYDVTVCRLR